MNDRFITKNFCCSEVGCHQCFALGKEYIVNEENIKILQAFRDYLSEKNGREISIYISSGCRCPEHNSMSGGAPFSAHIEGKAWDILSPSVNVFDLIQHAKNFGAFGGIGLNTRVSVEKGVPTVHLDLLSRKADWLRIIVEGKKYYIYF